MHVILLGAMLETAWEARHDRILGFGHVDLVVDDVAGMGDPLAAAEELIIHRLPEGVAHTAMMAGDARRRLLHRGTEIERFQPSRSWTWCRSARSMTAHGYRGIGQRRRLDVSIRTSNPSCLQPASHLSRRRDQGSCPGQPPHTIIALRILPARCSSPSRRSAGRASSSSDARPSFRASPAGLRRLRSGTLPWLPTHAASGW